MEKITFNNMVELRAFCLNMAIERRVDNLTCEAIVGTAREFEKYIVGNAALPEYTKPNEALDNYMAFLMESVKGASERSREIFEQKQFEDTLEQLGIKAL